MLTTPKPRIGAVLCVMRDRCRGRDADAAMLSKLVVCGLQAPGFDAKLSNSATPLGSRSPFVRIRDFWHSF